MCAEEPPIHWVGEVGNRRQILDGIVKPERGRHRQEDFRDGQSIEGDSQGLANGTACAITGNEISSGQITLRSVLNLFNRQCDAVIILADGNRLCSVNDLYLAVALDHFTKLFG